MKILPKYRKRVNKWHTSFYSGCHLSSNFLARKKLIIEDFSCDQLFYCKKEKNRVGNYAHICFLTDVVFVVAAVVVVAVDNNDDVEKK